mmetsp:Transcript_9084/g.30097  ORF Transcript_9084/g.30097 Transcript_9084/m.30097 type:complete len:230 (+) Transcript_9084:1663-2352(+)
MHGGLLADVELHHVEPEGLPEADNLRELLVAPAHDRAEAALNQVEVLEHLLLTAVAPVRGGDAREVVDVVLEVHEQLVGVAVLELLLQRAEAQVDGAQGLLHAVADNTQFHAEGLVLERLRARDLVPKLAEVAGDRLAKLHRNLHHLGGVGEGVLQLAEAAHVLRQDHAALEQRRHAGGVGLHVRVAIAVAADPRPEADEGGDLEGALPVDVVGGAGGEVVRLQRGLDE